MRLEHPLPSTHISPWEKELQETRNENYQQATLAFKKLHSLPASKAEAVGFAWARSA